MPNKGRSTRLKAKASGRSTRTSPPGGKERIKTLKDIKKHLLDRQAEIGRGMEQSMDHNDAPPLTHGDASDLAADALDSDTTLQLAERGSDELAQIQEALRKIDDGTYGECEVCSSEIPMTRLQALPYATLCVKCKEQQEREGGLAGGASWGGDDELDDMEVPE
jgi:DnaK suppressor protein